MSDLSGSKEHPEVAEQNDPIEAQSSLSNRLSKDFDTALQEESEAKDGDVGAQVAPAAAAEATQSTTEEITPEDRPSAEHTPEEQQPQSDGKEEMSQDSISRTASRDRPDIEREASEHMARRAAGMSLGEQGGDGKDTAAVNSSQQDEDSPEEAPPVPPRKNSTSKVAEVEYDEKQTPAEESQAEVPEAPKGTTEATGLEIQTIMDQFQEGTGPTSNEIMSPRLDRQQPVLVLPPRSSSLEPKDSYTLSQQHSVPSVTSPVSPQGTGNSRSSVSVHGVNNDDTESIISAKAGSIFQPPPPSPDPEPALPFDFHRFLEQLRHRTADPVARFLRSFLTEFGKKQWMVHEQVKIISDFLEFISKKMHHCEVWRTVSDAEFDNAREGMEKLVMNRLYSQTFSPAISPAGGSPRKGGRGGRTQADVASPHGPGRRGQHQEDVERDDVIAQKIKIYDWISEEHLDIKPVGDKGKKFLSLAQQELLKINTYRAPRDKVICVLNTCKVLFGFLRNAKSDQSADSFVPLLIYTVLRARPEHLVSNVQYIWRFRNQDKLGGEAGYYMSSLMGVVAFIENLDRTNLTISDEEFERNVEQAVSAIAEKNRAEENEEKTHNAAPMQHLSEKSALSRAEVTPRNSTDAEHSSPRRNPSQRHNEKAAQAGENEEDDMDAVTGLLRSIQKPLNSIGRIFSDDSEKQGLGLRATSQQGSSSPRRGPSPSSRMDRSSNQRVSSERQRSQQRQTTSLDTVAKQASVETAQAQRVRVQEHKVVVE